MQKTVVLAGCVLVAALVVLLLLLRLMFTDRQVGSPISQ
jgi:hypothetical protein